jgi:hypothetical protein
MAYKLPGQTGSIESKELEVEHVSTIQAAEESAKEFINKSIQSDNADIPPDSILSDDFLWDISEKILTYCEIQAGCTLYSYQRQFGRRFVFALIAEDPTTLTALFARQGGKTHVVATVIDGLLIILPILAKLYKDPRITKFNSGLWVGVFGPTYELAGIMYNRMRELLFSAHAIQVMKDPDIALDLSNFRGKALRLPNGSYVDVQSAGPGSKIEGKTYHIAIMEESQDISNIKIRKSIHPMLASTSGPKIKIGTPNPDKNDFYDACQRNKESDTAYLMSHNEKKLERVRRHFEYDYTHVSKANPRYAKYIKAEIEDLGFDSDEFRMSYRLHWLTERGRFITADILDKCGIKRGTTLTWKNDGGEIKSTFVTSATVQPTYDGQVVVAADFGKVKSSTVLTAAQVWYDHEFYDGQEPRYRAHILDWLELEGDDHERQHGQIMDWLNRYPKIYKFIGDATGKGDPILSRIKAELQAKDIVVVPFIFSTQSKHDGYTVLMKEFYAGRLTFPAGKDNANYRLKRFYKQMIDLSKTWKGRYMVVEKQHDDPTAQDDYCDSIMMLCWGVNVDRTGKTEELIENPFFEGRRGFLLGQSRAQPYWKEDNRNRHRW